MVVGIIIAVIVVLIVLWAVSAYNGLVTLRNRVKNGWAQIDVQLKQRTDLIPNLVETVKGYAAHESPVSHFHAICMETQKCPVPSGTGHFSQSAMLRGILLRRQSSKGSKSRRTRRRGRSERSSRSARYSS